MFLWLQKNRPIPGRRNWLTCLARPHTYQSRCGDNTIFREDFIANPLGKAIDFDFCCRSDSEPFHRWQ